MNTVILCVYCDSIFMWMEKIHGMVESWKKHIVDMPVIICGYMKFQMWWDQLKTEFEGAGYRVTLVPFDTNVGKAVAVNQAMKHVSSDTSYIFISDGDIQITRYTIENMIRCAHEYNMSCNQMLGYIASSQDQDDRTLVPGMKKNLSWVECETNPPAGGFIMIAPSIFHLVGGYKVHFSAGTEYAQEDLILFTDVVSIGAKVLLSLESVVIHPFSESVALQQADTEKREKLARIEDIETPRPLPMDSFVDMQPTNKKINLRIQNAMRHWGK